MLPWLLQNTILAGVLALAVALLCRWRRVGPALRHALWVLVLLRLVWPPGVVTWPWQLPALPKSEAVAAVPVETLEVASVPAATSGDGVLEGIEIRTVAEEPAAPVTETSITPAVSEPIRWRVVGWWVVVSLWAAGAVIVAARHLHGLVKLLGVVRNSQPASAGANRHVGEMAGRLGIRTPRVRVVAGLGSPLVAGLVRPVLLWPKELQDRLGEDGMKAILIHELAHVRRRDHWVRWVEMAAGCVWWWNPLYRLARRRVRQYAELACDAWVLAILPRARRAYAEALLQVCETVSKAGEPAPVLGVGGDPGDIQRRLTMIMRETVSCRVPRRALLALSLLALLAIPGWSLSEPSAPAAVVDEIVTANEIDAQLDILFSDVLRFETETATAEPQPDREQRLAAIEAKVVALLKEIQALKAERSTGKDSTARSAAAKTLLDQAKARAEVERQKQLFDARQKLLADELKRKQAARTTEKDVLVHRMSYTLPHAKAEALAKLLKDFTKGGKIESSVSGSRLTVVTTPENQAVIGKLIKLIQEMPSSASPKK